MSFAPRVLVLAPREADYRRIRRALRAGPAAGGVARVREPAGLAAAAGGGARLAIVVDDGTRPDLPAAVRAALARVPDLAVVGVAGGERAGGAGPLLAAGAAPVLALGDRAGLVAAVADRLRGGRAGAGTGADRARPPAKDRPAPADAAERRYRHLFEAAPVSLWEQDHRAVVEALAALRAEGVTDFAGYFDAHPEFVERMASLIRILDVNEATLRLYRAPSREALLGRLDRVFTPESYEVFKRELVVMAEGGTRFVAEAENRTVDGRRLDVIVHAAIPPAGATDRPLLIGISDIGERKRAERALAESEQRFRTLASFAPVGIFRHDGAGECVYVNERCAEITGLPARRHAGDGWLEAVHPEDRRRVRAAWRAAVAAGEAFRATYRFLHPDGTVVWAIDETRPLLGAGGEPSGFIGTLTDITERVAAEQALAASEERFRDFAEVAANWFWETDAELRFTYVSRGVREILGAHAEAIIGSTREDLHRRVSDLDSPAWREHLAALRRHEPFRDFEVQWPDAAGNPRWIALSGRPRFGSAGEFLGYRGVGVEITGRKLAERALRESEASLSEAQRIAALGSWELDLVGNRLRWSDEIFRIFELDPARFGASYEAFLDLVHPEDRALVDEVYTRSVRERTPYDVTHRLLMPDGRVKHVHERGRTDYADDGRPLRTVGTVQDVTERIRLEQVAREQQRQLIQADKLVSLGTLVSGVAHEVNNPNHLVQMNARTLADVWTDVRPILDRQLEEEPDLLLGGLPYAELRDEISTMIEDVHAAARRIDRIVSSLKDFARPTAGEPRPVPVNEAIEAALALLSPRIKRSAVQVRASLAPDLPPLEADPQRLEQIVVNLVSNALDAVAETAGTVRLASRWDGRAGEVEVEVGDDGPGIPEAIRSRIFDPFFTTRQERGGTGLGLSIVYSLVRELGGRIEVEPAGAPGAVLRVRLPAWRLGGGE